MSKSSLLFLVCIGFCVPYALVFYQVICGLRLKGQVDNDRKALRAMDREWLQEAELLLAHLRQARAAK
jgi:hypothetical protein